MDNAQPISYGALERGTPVVSSTGGQFGTVRHVLQDESLDLFDGLAVETAHGLRFVGRDSVQSIYSTVVRTSLSDAEVALLPKPEGPEVFHADPTLDTGDSLSAWFGRVFRRDHWTRGE